MKKIEKQLTKSVKRLPSMQKELIISNPKKKFTVKPLYGIAVAALSLMICFGIIFSFKFDLIKSIVVSNTPKKTETITKPEANTNSEASTITESTASVIVNKTITVPINVNFEGDTSQTKTLQSNTYEVLEGDTVILDVKVNVITTADIGNIISTINFDPTKVGFVSCSNNAYKQEGDGKILVEYYGGYTKEQGTSFKIIFKAISSGQVGFNSEISCFIIKAFDHSSLIDKMNDEAREDMEEYNEEHGIYGSIDDIVGNYNSGNGNGNSSEIVIFP